MHRNKKPSLDDLVGGSGLPSISAISIPWVRTTIQVACRDTAASVACNAPVAASGARLRREKTDGPETRQKPKAAEGAYATHNPATGAALQGSPGYLLPGVADAFAALRLLSGDPRIDADRIAIVGFSYGAEVAHLAAFEPLRSALNPGAGRFAAHVAFYPGGTFGAIAETGAYTGAPGLMLLGGKDDNLPVAKIESYLAYARAAGAPAPIETVIYPGAYHGWTFPDLPTARFYPDFVSTKNVRSSCSGGRRLLC